MSAMIDERVDSDSLTLLGLDWHFAIPCDATDNDGEPSCDNEAVWRLVLSCCGMNFFLCDKDKEEQLYLMAKADVVYHVEPAKGACGSKNTKIVSIERI